MASTQDAITVQEEIGKPVVKVTRPIPTPKASELLVKVTVAGINPHDQKIRDGGLFNPTAGLPLAADVVGVVAAVGSDVHTFKIGDRAAFLSMITADTGGLQQYAITEAALAGHIPSKITDDEAATLPVNLFSPFAALFSADCLGIQAPFQNATDSKKIDYAGSSIVIIGGGSNCGKFAVQLAALAGIGKIIVVASNGSAAELKSYGATHIIDRHLVPEEIKTKTHEIVGDELVYVFDAINDDYTLGVSFLSSTKRGKVVGLLPPTVDASKIGEKKEGYDVVFTNALKILTGDIGREFYAELPHWLETGKIKPLGYKVVEGGFSVDGVNKVLDDYRDGKFPGKYHVHLNKN